MKTADLSALPALPRDEQGPVFREPWQAQAFALTLKLHEAGCFNWREWAEQLATEIAAARQRGEPDLGDTYYEYWLAALEKIVTEKGIVASDVLRQRREEWAHAANTTPHGQPIELGCERSGS